MATFGEEAGIGATTEQDPLDKLMYVLAAVSCLSAGGTYAGYGKPVASVLGALGAAAYLKAPRRKFPTAESIASGCDLTGKVCIVTGPTSGIGTETARVLALRGAHVILAARSEKKLSDTKKELEESLAQKGVKAKLTGLVVDLGDLKSVAEFVKQFKALKLPLHLLICNAGVMALRERRPTVQGFEQQVGMNHIGHFHLTMLLTDVLKASSTPQAKSRVVILSSTAYRFAKQKFFQASNARLETEPYDQWSAYGNAKLSNMLFAREYHARYASQGVEACSVMPGGIHTGLQGEVSWWTAIKWRVVTPFFFKSIEQGAATTITAALKSDLSDAANGGAYFNDCKATSIASKMPQEACTWLWTATDNAIKSAL